MEFGIFEINPIDMSSNQLLHIQWVLIITCFCPRLSPWQTAQRPPIKCSKYFNISLKYLAHFSPNFTGLSKRAIFGFDFRRLLSLSRPRFEIEQGIRKLLKICKRRWQDYLHAKFSKVRSMPLENIHFGIRASLKTDIVNNSALQILKCRQFFLHTDAT